MPQPELQACQNCQYYIRDQRPDYADKGGHCHRYPPQIIHTFGPDPYGGKIADVDQHSPWLRPIEWCGEWKMVNANSYR